MFRLFNFVAWVFIVFVEILFVTVFAFVWGRVSVFNFGDDCLREDLCCVSYISCRGVYVFVDLR